MGLLYTLAKGNLLAAPCAPTSARLCCAVALDLAHRLKELVLPRIAARGLDVHDGDDGMYEQGNRASHKAKPGIPHQHASLKSASTQSKHKHLWRGGDACRHALLEARQQIALH